MARGSPREEAPAGPSSCTTWRPRPPPREAGAPGRSIRVSAENLAVVAGAQGAEDGQRGPLLDEPDRSVGEEEVDAAGVGAPEVVGCRVRGVDVLVGGVGHDELGAMGRAGVVAR